MRSSLQLGALASVGLLTVAGCSSGQAYPDEAAALEYLSMLTSVTQAGHPEKVCDTSSFSQVACRNALGIFAREAPEKDPKVVCTWVHEDTYRVLVVKGESASGRRYINHLALSTTKSGETEAFWPIYWLNKPPPGTDESQDWEPEAVCG